ncbi:hypothetical protein BBP40_007224 [Aspergillus hancockii]|nr:hypothetical protein BBP40_007224 [Aspergillus hancockii]
MRVAPCSFSDAHCSQMIDSDTYLTIDFSAENGTLLANDDPIFPSTLPMEFHAIRHGQSGEEAVIVAYELDTRPMPSRSDAPLEETFSLKLKLFDLRGRPASDFIIAVSLTKDADGNLLISQLETNPILSRHHHHPSSWMTHVSATLQAMKDAARDCMHGSRHSSPRPQHGHMQPPLVDMHRTIAPQHHPHHHHHRPGYWAGREKNFGRLMRPVVLPALLGVMAGVIACMVGFILGRIIIGVYYCVHGCRRQSIPTIRVDEVESAPTEKERLMQMYDEQS